LRSGEKGSLAGQDARWGGGRWSKIPQATYLINTIRSGNVRRFSYFLGWNLLAEVVVENAEASSSRLAKSTTPRPTQEERIGGGGGGGKGKGGVGKRGEARHWHTASKRGKCRKLAVVGRHNWFYGEGGKVKTGDGVSY